MTFHLQTLALAMVTVSVVTLICLAPPLLRFAEEFRDGMRAWVIGTALVVSTDVIFFIGPEIPYLDTLLTAIAGIGVAEWMHALRRYVGRSARAKWPYPVIAVATLISLAMPSYPMSVLTTTVLYVILYTGAAVCAAGIKEPARSIGRLLLIGVFVLIAVVMAGRLALFVSGIRSGAPPGFTSPVRALMFIVASIAPIAASFAFVLAVGERLGHRLLHWSMTDSLTGIPNRRALFDALQRALASSRRHGGPVSLMVVDVDHFKRVNDAAGHDAGDEVLVAIAERLVEAARTEDSVGRLGGEEFAVVVPGEDLAGALHAAERLRAVIGSTPFEAASRTFTLTASIGVAEWDRSEEPTSLLSRADRLLYQAKDKGRDTVISR